MMEWPSLGLSGLKVGWGCREMLARWGLLCIWKWKAQKGTWGQRCLGHRDCKG